MLQVEHITKKYVTGELTQMALDDVSLSFRDNEFVAILGPSGSGKTTLLNVIGGLDRYDHGDLIINGVSTKKYRDRDWDAYRNHTIGFIFQSYNLIPHQNVLSNVELSLTLSNISRQEKKARAREALEKVGLGDQLHKKPNQLSGGQMQRVAIARALVNNPDIILADEPTGALDTATSLQVMDLLKEVAKDKLVIMVTHNPELAEQYATRIVNLRDGKITSDSDPVALQDIAATDTRMKHTKLSFLTALSLSLNNLMTKKGRTFLTAFAGSIGIIGIAAILALSNGVNDYIAEQEQEMLGSYPVILEKQTVDLESMMDRRDKRMDELQKERNAAYDEGTIYSNNIVADTVKTEEDMIKTNDLGKFKRYLDANKQDIADDYVAIEYNYAITPYVYRKDEKEGIVTVSPSTLSSATGDSSSTSSFSSSAAFSGFSISNYISSSWTQLVSDRTLREQQYTLLAGNWPKKANEVALIVTENHEVSDYTLYTLGFMDIEKMSDLIDAVKNGKTYEDPTLEFELNDFIGKRYRVFAPCQLYKKSGNAYIDKSDDDSYIKKHYSEAITVHISCVLQSKATSGINSGIAYTSQLTEKLLAITHKSDIIKKQLKNTKVNVLTGEKFSKAKKKKKKLSLIGTTSGFKPSDLADDSLRDARLAVRMINVKEGELTESSATEEESSQTQSSETTSSESKTSESSSASHSETSSDTFRVRFLNYDGSVLSAAESYKAGDKITSLPASDPTRSATDTTRYMFIGWYSSADGGFYRSAQLPEVTQSVDYTAMYYGYNANIADELPEGMTLEELEKYITQYLEEIGAGGTINKEALDKLIAEVLKGSGLINDDVIGQYLEDYIKKNPQLAEKMMAEYMKKYLKANSNMTEKMIQQYLQKYLKKYQEAMMAKIKGMMNMNLTEDQLAVLLASMSGTTPTSADEVLNLLGYYTIEEPSSISIYPYSFDSKDHIKEFIKTYNDQITKDSDKVTYSDVIGVLTQSVTNIIDMITYVLIAFVAISLIVSSIMIAIITYISVLERTKEIGVLRALGASKNDISKIFNAETFIEGLISGVIGIVVTLTGCMIANGIIEKVLDVKNLARLPIKYAMILILISIVLTLIAGFLPSRIAAKKDPVTALRSE